MNEKKLDIIEELSAEQVFILYDSIKNSIETRPINKEKCSSGCLFQATSEFSCNLFNSLTKDYNRCSKCLKLFPEM